MKVSLFNCLLLVIVVTAGAPHHVHSQAVRDLIKDKISEDAAHSYVWAIDVTKTKAAAQKVWGINPNKLEVSRSYKIYFTKQRNTRDFYPLLVAETYADKSGKRGVSGWTITGTGDTVRTEYYDAFTNTQYDSLKAYIRENFDGNNTLYESPLNDALFSRQTPGVQKNSDQLAWLKIYSRHSIMEKRGSRSPDYYNAQMAEAGSALTELTAAREADALNRTKYDELKAAYDDSLARPVQPLTAVKQSEFSRKQTMYASMLKQLDAKSLSYTADEKSYTDQRNASADSLDLLNASQAYFDVSLTPAPPIITNISGSWSVISLDALGLKGFGFEASLGDDKTLSLLPLQASYVTMGARFLLDFAGRERPVSDSKFFLDTRVLIRQAVNIRSLIENNNLHHSRSLMSIDLPKINFGSGAMIDVSTSKISFAENLASKLPVLNFSYATGFGNLADPSITFTDNAGKYAYYSDNQWEASASFFWKADHAGDNRFKLDIGAGGYDLLRVMYDKDDHVYSHHQEILVTDVQLMVGLDFSHQTDYTGYGCAVRVFDNRVNSLVWLKLWKMKNYGEFRLECKLISAPFSRSQMPWESDGGNIIQLRYRTGF